MKPSRRALKILTSGIRSESVTAVRGARMVAVALAVLSAPLIFASARTATRASHAAARHETAASSSITCAPVAIRHDVSSGVPREATSWPNALLALAAAPIDLRSCQDEQLAVTASRVSVGARVLRGYDTAAPPRHRAL
jgi:hypothetical protein